MDPAHNRPRRAVRVLSRVPFLPSLLTLGNAFCGFLAMAKIADAARVAGEGEVTSRILALVELACFLIFLAMFFDGLDGKVARLTDQATNFGAQLDSLADALTFGAAPAFAGKFLVDLYLDLPPKFSYLCAALYCLCAVLRLARFNVETPGLDERSHLEFKGLPSPAAAAFLASLMLFICTRNSPPGEQPLLAQRYQGMQALLTVSLPPAMVGCGFLMVSNLPYPHLLNTLLRGRKSFPSLAVAVFLLVMSPLAWHEILILGCVLYLFSGPVIAVLRFFSGRGRFPGVGGDEEEEGPRSRGMFAGPGFHCSPGCAP